MKLIFKHVVLISALYLAANINSASAATSTSNMAVTANVAASCTITASPLPFGAFTGAQLDVNTSVSATCTNGAPYTIDLSAGAGTGATTSARVMTNTNATSNTLTYSIYTNVGRTTVCGVGCVSGATGNGTAQATTLYGRMTAASNPYVGPYTDTVVATLNY